MSTSIVQSTQDNVKRFAGKAPLRRRLGRLASRPGVEPQGDTICPNLTDSFIRLGRRLASPDYFSTGGTECKQVSEHLTYSDTLGILEASHQSVSAEDPDGFFH